MSAIDAALSFVEATKVRRIVGISCVGVATMMATSFRKGSNSND